MTGTITIGGRNIKYELIRKKVKNINLRVKPDGNIIISADNRVGKKHIEDFMIRKADWIEKALKRFESLDGIRSKGFEPADGECIKLLGKEHKIYIISSNQNRIELKNTCVYIYTKYPEDKHKINIQWGKWYELFVKEIFYLVVKEMYSKFLPYHINMPEIKLRNMKTQWGSCSVYTETITLNKTLIHAPIECVEYVAAHELTHFLQPNHSREFYDMFRTVMPDYKERKKLLESQGIYY